MTFFCYNPEAKAENTKSFFLCLNSLKDKSTFLLVLDAKTFEELGRAAVPVNIPYGFHGTFRDRYGVGKKMLNVPLTSSGEIVMAEVLCYVNAADDVLCHHTDKQIIKDMNV